MQIELRFNFLHLIRIYISLYRPCRLQLSVSIAKLINYPSHCDRLFKLQPCACDPDAQCSVPTPPPSPTSIAQPTQEPFTSFFYLACHAPHLLQPQALLQTDLLQELGRGSLLKCLKRAARGMTNTLERKFDR